jgi:anti-anti-sigma factor
MQWGQLQLERTETGDHKVHYRLQGGLSYGEAGSGFVEAIKNDLQAGRREFVLDLEGLERMDSGGIGLLASAYMSVHNARGSMTLDAVPDRWRKLLKAVGLSAAFGLDPGAR